jgi:hypothetical protein
MNDRWRAVTKTLEIHGQPIVFIEVDIVRHIAVDARYLKDLQGQLLEAGLSGLVDFTKSALDSPAEARRYCVVDWTEADAKRIDLQQFARIVEYFSDKSFFSIDGNADQGFTAKLTTHARQTSHVLTEENIPGLRGDLALAEQEARDAGFDAMEKQCQAVSERLAAVRTCLEQVRTVRELARQQAEADRQREAAERADRSRGDCLDLLDRLDRGETLRGDDVDRLDRAMRTA